MPSQIFIADEPEVEALPRHRVAEYLEQLDKPTCVRYLEHIIDELGEAGPDFHDKLAELYLAEVRRQWIKGNEGERPGPRELLACISDSVKTPTRQRTSVYSNSCGTLLSIGRKGFSADQRWKVSMSQGVPQAATHVHRLADMPRARALLLGRLGNHEAALQIYVNRLESYSDAEE